MTDKHPMSIEKHIVLKPQTSELIKLETELQTFAQQADLEAFTFNLNLVLDELVTNIISYAFDSTDNNDQTINIHLSYDENQQLLIILTDAGKAFDPTMTAPPSLEENLDARKIGGLGIHFVNTIMDDMQYQRLDGKNQLTLSKKID